MPKIGTAARGKQAAQEADQGQSAAPGGGEGSL
jgi:hypothetical protein